MVTPVTPLLLLLFMIIKTFKRSKSRKMEARGKDRSVGKERTIRSVEEKDKR